MASTRMPISQTLFKYMKNLLDGNLPLNTAEVKY